MSSVKFLSDKAKGGVLEKTGPAGVQVNEFYFEDELGVLRLNPCKVFVLDVFRHKAQLDGEGKLAAAKSEEFDETGTAFKERAIALVLVQHPAGWLPATITTVKAMCRPWQVARTLLGEAKQTVLKGTPGYAEVYDAAVKPNGRFVLTLTGGQEKGQGKMAYNIAKAVASPPSAEDVAAFNEFVNGDGYTQALEMFGKQVEAVQKLIG